MNLLVLAYGSEQYVPISKTRSPCSRFFLYAVSRQGVTPMTDEIRARIEKYEKSAADCEIIARLAAEPAKRELYERLAFQYHETIADLKRLIDIRSAA